MENNIEEQSALTPPLKSIVVNGKKKVAVNGVVNLNIPQGGGEQVQADWNQNDSTAVDYIKNRICYSSIDERGYFLSDNDKNPVYAPDYDHDWDLPVFWEYPYASIDTALLNSFVGRSIYMVAEEDEQGLPESVYSGVFGAVDSQDDYRLEKVSDTLYMIYTVADDMNLGYISLADNQTVDDITLNKGVYIKVYGEVLTDEEYNPIGLKYYEYNISPAYTYHKLDEKYIPDTIVRTSQLGGAIFKIESDALKVSIDGGSTWKTVTLSSFHGVIVNNKSPLS